MKKLFLALTLIMLTVVPSFSGNKVIKDVVIDAALDKLATGVMARYCSGASAPTDRAAAITATLANVVITPAHGAGDWTKAAGDVSGRKLTLGAQAGMSPSGTGTVEQVCVDDGSVLLGCTTLSPTVAVTIGVGTYDAPSVDFWEVRASQ